MTEEQEAPRGREDRLDRQGLANAVTARMKELAIEQGELARRADVSISYLRHMQNGTGTSEFSYSTLTRVSQALKWPTEHLHKIFHRLQDENFITPSGAEIFTRAIMAELRPYLARIDAIDKRLSEVMDLIHHVNDRIDVALNAETQRTEDQ